MSAKEIRIAAEEGTHLDAIGLFISVSKEPYDGRGSGMAQLMVDPNETDKVTVTYDGTWIDTNLSKADGTPVEKRNYSTHRDKDGKPVKVFRKESAE